MKKIFWNFLFFTILILNFLPLASLANNSVNVRGSLEDAAKAGYGAKPKIQDLPTAAGQIIGYLLSFLGVIFLGLMIYGGFLWMTAMGEEQQTTKAKDTITAAIIGLIIISAAYAITAFIGGKLAG